MVAEFVEYARSLGVAQDEVLQLPLNLFISWLIISAAERDGDPLPAHVTPREQLVAIRNPQCLACKRFIPQKHYKARFPYCNPKHALKHAKKFELIT